MSTQQQKPVFFAYRCDECGCNVPQLEVWCHRDPIKQRDESNDSAGGDWWCPQCQQHMRSVEEYTLEGAEHDAALANQQAEQIRNAAPALLAALERLLTWDDGNLPGDLIDEARTAVAQARGEVQS